MTPTNDNNSRPASFDAAVLQWIPLLRKLAARFESREQDREDLVQETIATALHRWASFKPDGKMSGWLMYQMRERCQAARARNKYANAVSLDDDTTATPQTQEGTIVARQALEALNDNRAENALVRLAMGDTLEEVGATIGLSGERVRQITTTARRQFGKRVGYKVAA